MGDLSGVLFLNYICFISKINYICFIFIFCLLIPNWFLYPHWECKGKSQLSTVCFPYRQNVWLTTSQTKWHILVIDYTLVINYMINLLRSCNLDDEEFLRTWRKFRSSKINHVDRSCNLFRLSHDQVSSGRKMIWKVSSDFKFFLYKLNPKFVS